MISALTGQLERVDDDRVHLSAGAFLFELLIPASDVKALRENVGQSITFHTIFDLEGDATRGGLSPRLIGFRRPQDKRFFELFITVKGIGPKKALRALTEPAGEIARAIENKDAKALSQLEGIGRRMAEQIVAELSGKVAAFVGIDAAPGKSSRLESGKSGIEEEAILVCTTLGVPRPEAERLLEKARQTQPPLKTADALSRQMLRMRSEGT